MRRHCAGAVTFAELGVSILVLMVVSAGTMASFVTASRMQRHSAAPDTEATMFAQETIEKFRNHMSCDDPWYAGSTNCTVNLPLTWTADPLPLPTSGGTESILAGPVAARRCYRVQPDCGNNCWKIDVQVCWGLNQTGCNC